MKAIEEVRDFFMSTRERISCDGCNKELTSREHIHASLTWAGADVVDPVELDFCDTKCGAKYFRRRVKEETERGKEGEQWPQQSTTIAT